MKKPLDPSLFNARIYQSGSSNAQPYKVGLDGGEIFLADQKGNVVDELQGDDWNLSLGGTNNERVVLKHVSSGHTILADLEFLNSLASGTNYSHLTAEAKRLKKGAFGRSVSRSSGTIALAVLVVLFIGWVILGFSHMGDGRLSYNHGRSRTGNSPVREVQTVDAPDEDDGQKYMKLIAPVIKEHWYPPRSVEHMSTVVRFSVSRDGHISNARVSRGSGDDDFDKVGLAALKQVSKLPPLPESLAAPSQVEFTFTYNPAREKHSRRKNLSNSED